jgi:hypothetical protein
MPLGAGEAKSLIRLVEQELCEAGENWPVYLSLNASDPILAKGESK